MCIYAFIMWRINFAVHINFTVSKTVLNIYKKARNFCRLYCTMKREREIENVNKRNKKYLRRCRGIMMIIMVFLISRWHYFRELFYGHLPLRTLRKNLDLRQQDASYLSRNFVGIKSSPSSSSSVTEKITTDVIMLSHACLAGRGFTAFNILLSISRNDFAPLVPAMKDGIFMRQWERHRVLSSLLCKSFDRPLDDPLFKRDNY